MSERCNAVTNDVSNAVRNTNPDPTRKYFYGGRPSFGSWIPIHSSDGHLVRARRG